MIDLYFWMTPNGYKVTIMLEELGWKYNVIPINIGKGDQFKPDFLKISPNNRMPALVDHDGPDGKPISVFESGAMLMYLAEKAGFQFMPQDMRRRYDVIQWLMFQMASVGPMLGQAHHFRRYAPEKIEYAIARYTNEVRRLYGVMNKRLATRDYLAGAYSIADMACVGWARGWERQGQDIGEFPHFKRWLERVTARPAVQRGVALRVEEAGKVDIAKDKEAWKILFTQGARA